MNVYNSVQKVTHYSNKIHIHIKVNIFKEIISFQYLQYIRWEDFGNMDST
jgi:hypothetical protein